MEQAEVYMIDFGPERIFNKAISETGIMGLAAGAAACDFRPVVEIIFMDFMTVCMDGIVNQIAKMRYMFGSQCTMPVAIRTPAGGVLNAGPQHSQCLEALFAHIRGIKLVMPGTLMMKRVFSNKSYWMTTH